MNPALMQRLVTFNTYFFGFLILDRLSFFGDPPSVSESWLMALVLGVAVTLLPPRLAGFLSTPRAAEKSRPGRRGGIEVEADRVASDAVDPDFGFKLQVDPTTTVAETETVGFTGGDDRAAWVEPATTWDP